MHAAEASFVSLADILRARPALQRSAPEEATPSAAAAGPGSISPALISPASGLPAAASPAAAAPTDGSAPAAPLLDVPEPKAALREARLFRAALADTFDALVVNLARELALQVLARELRLAAVDIEMLAGRLIAECWAEEPLRLRVAPADAQVACDLPVSVDSGLRPGDAILECRSGSIDARLRVRLANVLAAVDG